MERVHHNRLEPEEESVKPEFQHLDERAEVTKQLGQMLEFLDKLKGHLEDGTKSVNLPLIKKELVKCCNMIDWEIADSGEVGDFIAQLNAFDDSERERIDGNRFGESEFDRSGRFIAGDMVVDGMPTSVIQEGYYSCPEIHHAVNGVFESAGSAYPLSPCHSKLAIKIYGSPDAVMRLPEGTNQVIDRLRETDGEWSVFAVDMFELDLAPQDEFESLDAYGEYLEVCVAETLELGAGLSEKLARKFGYAIARSEVSIAKQPKGNMKIKKKEIVNDVARVYSTVMALGKDTIEAIDEEFGLIDLRKYEESDLKRLSTLLEDTEKRDALVTYLSQGDVTAIFSDTHGDHNGAFKNAFSRYYVPDDRKLTFEVGKPEDFHRIMMKLYRLGIKPSRVVVSAHGGKDGMNFGQVNGLDEGVYAGSHEGTQRQSKPATVDNIEEARLGVLAAKCMKPSVATGRRTVILDTCYGDAVESVKIGDIETESTTVASSVAKALRREDTDIFASKDSIVCEVSEDDEVVFLADDGSDKYIIPSMVKLTYEEPKGERAFSYLRSPVRREDVNYVYKPAE